MKDYCTCWNDHTLTPHSDGIAFAIYHLQFTICHLDNHSELTVLQILNVALKAKEVVLDSLQRVLLAVLLPLKIAEPFRKLLVTITQTNFRGDPHKAANGISCTAPFLEQLYTLLVSLVVSFRC